MYALSRITGLWDFVYTMLQQTVPQCISYIPSLHTSEPIRERAHALCSRCLHCTYEALNHCLGRWEYLRYMPWCLVLRPLSCNYLDVSDRQPFGTALWRLMNAWVVQKSPRSQFKFVKLEAISITKAPSIYQNINQTNINRNQHTNYVLFKPKQTPNKLLILLFVLCFFFLSKNAFGGPL